MSRDQPDPRAHALIVGPYLVGGPVTLNVRCLWGETPHANASCLMQLWSAHRSGRGWAGTHLHLPLPGLPTPNRQRLRRTGQVSSRRPPLTSSV